MVRPVATAAVVLTAAGVVGMTIVEPSASWVSVIAVGSLSGLLAGAAYVLLGASDEIRRDLFGRVLNVVGRGPNADATTGEPGGDVDVDDGLTGWMSEARPA
jgi:hypothetical protein